MDDQDDMGETNMGETSGEHITLGDVVNPSLFWASYPQGSDKETTYYRHLIDSELREFFSARRYPRHADPDLLEPKMKVAVRYPDATTWSRAEILGKTKGNEDLFDVFLVDNGVSLELGVEKIFLISPKITNHKSQAFLIALYGIEPLSLDLDLVAKKSYLQASSWSPNHLKFIQMLVEAAEGAWFKTIQTVNNVKHGVLYLQISCDRINVNEKLCELKHASFRDSVVNLNKFLTRQKHYHHVTEIMSYSPTNKRDSLDGKHSDSKRKNRSLDLMEDENDASENVSTSGSFFVERPGSNRPSVAPVPAGYIRQNQPKQKKSPVSKPTAVRRDRSPTFSVSTQQIKDRPTPQPCDEAWSEDESVGETPVKGGESSGKDKVCKDEVRSSSLASPPVVSSNSKASAPVVSSSSKALAPEKSVANVQKTGIFKTMKSYFTGPSDDDDSDENSDNNDCSNAPACSNAPEKTSAILSLYLNKCKVSEPTTSVSPASKNSPNSRTNVSDRDLNQSYSPPTPSQVHPSVVKSPVEGVGRGRGILLDSCGPTKIGDLTSSPSQDNSNVSPSSSKTTTPVRGQFSNAPSPTQSVSSCSRSPAEGTGRGRGIWLDNNYQREVGSLVSPSTQRASINQNVSSAQNGNEIKSQSMKQKSDEFSSSSDANSNRKSITKNNSFECYSDTTSQSNLSQSDMNISESQCNASVSSSRSSQKPPGDKSLSDSVSESEDVLKKLPTSQWDDVNVPHKGRILAHSNLEDNILFSDSLTDLGLNPDVKNALSKLKVVDLYRIQKYACPLILDLQLKDVAMVHQEQSGKSLSYIFPLVSHLHSGVIYRQIKQTNCPKAVIVCPWSSTCESIAHLFKKLMSHFRNDITIVTAYNSGKSSAIDKLITLLNGCDVLITTPRYLMHLFDQHLVINFDHVCHFVLDDCHDLFKFFEPEIVSICKKLVQVKSGKQLQVIAVSETYTINFDKLVRGFMRDPVLLIANAMEAAIYGKCYCKFAVTSPEEKFKSLLGMLEGFGAREMKTVIVCNTETVDPLHEMLQKEQFNSFPVKDFTIFDENIGKSRKSWLRGQLEGVHHPVIVCDDDSLVTLNIADAQILIHYDLPMTKSIFSSRYFSIFNNIHNRLMKNAELCYCKTGVIIDTDSTQQFPGLLDYVKRFLIKVELPSEAEEIARSILIVREEEKVDFPLCPRFLKFGECWPMLNCPKRHAFINEIDFPQYLPKKGFVKVKILHHLDASNFSARLLEHSLDSITWTPHTANYGVFSTKLNMYFMEPSNRYIKANPDLGDIVIFEQSVNNFKRAQIVEVPPKTRGKAQQFKIKLIDEGFVLEHLVADSLLLTAPERFQEDLPFAVDIFICGLKPIDLDHSWSRHAVSHIGRKIADYQKREVDGYFFTGKIMLALSSSLWLNPFECKQLLETTKTHVTMFSVKQELLDCNYAVKNPTHLPKLYELCRLKELPIPTYEMPTQNVVRTRRVVEKVKPQWAFLPLDETNRSESCTVNVFITHNENPDLLYLQQTKFVDRLLELHKSINETMKKEEKITKKNWKIGDLCLATFRDEDPEKWFRAQIIEELNDGGELEVFYVDYGQSDVLDFKQVIQIMPEFVSRLPFQAIECCLAAINPRDNHWEESAALVIDEFMVDKNGTCKTIQAKAIQIDEKAKQTGGRRYSVVLRDISDDGLTVINKELVQRGYAKFRRGAALILEPEIAFKDAITEEQNSEEDQDINDDDDWQSDESHSGNSLEDPSNYQGLDVRKFVNNYLENFDKDDHEGLMNLAKEWAASANGLDIQSVGFESIEESSGPSTSALPAIEEASESGTNSNDLPPPLKSIGKIPAVCWHQNDTHIFLKIQLIGVTDYFLDWGDNFLNFDTTLNRDFYHLELTFCGTINYQRVQHSAKGFHIDVKLEKQIPGTKWPRLTLETCKPPWLKFNHESIQDDEEEVFMSPFAAGLSGNVSYRNVAKPDGYYDDDDDVPEENFLREEERRYNRPEENDEYDPTA